MSEIINRAKKFASYAHKDHFRGDQAKTPYVQHLAEVAELVKLSGGSDDEIAAAWLHDSVEDTSTTITDICDEFGEGIAVIVAGVTDLPEWSSLSMSERKLRQVERVSVSSNSIKRVKLADQTSNVQIVGAGREFTIENCLAYVASASRIAEVCKGVSFYLDDLFRSRRYAAMENLEALQSRTG